MISEWLLQEYLRALKHKLVDDWDAARLAIYRELMTPCINRVQVAL